MKGGGGPENQYLIEPVVSVPLRGKKIYFPSVRQILFKKIYRYPDSRYFFRDFRIQKHVIFLAANLWDFSSGLAEVAGEAFAVVNEDHKEAHVRRALSALRGPAPQS